MSNQEQIDSLLEWCSRNKVHIDDRICLKLSPANGVAVHSKSTSVPPQTSLVQISKDSVLSVKLCLESSFKYEQYGLDAQLALSLALLIEILKEDKSKWYGYIQSFPRRLVEIPLFWTCAFQDAEAIQDGMEGTIWISGTEIEKKFLDSHKQPILERIDSYYHRIVEPYILEHIPDVSSKSTLWGFYRAYSLVSSRAFLVDAYHGLSMVPIADAFNHVAENHVHLESDFHVCPECGSLFECPHDREDTSDIYHDSSTPFARVAEGKGDSEIHHDNTYEMVSNILIPPDIEIFNTYGENLTNAQLLWQYGFILDGNEFDRITWAMDQVFDSLESEMTGRRKGHFQRLFEDLNDTFVAPDGMQNSSLIFFDSKQDALLSIDSEGRISHQLWLLLFVIASEGMVDEDELMEWTEQLFDFIKNMENQEDDGDPINTSIILEMGRLISVICKARRDRIGKPGVEDKEMGNILDQLPVNMPRTRAALSIAISEKSILTTCESAWTDIVNIFDD